MPGVSRGRSGPSGSPTLRAAAVCAVDDAFGIMLDAKRLLSPAKQPLTVPSRALAEAIAEEWQAQGPELRPHTMPLMRLRFQ